MTLPLPTDPTLDLATRIVLSVHARVSAILVSNRFKTDIGTAIFLGRPTIHFDKLPGSLVFSAKEDTDEEKAKQTTNLNTLGVFVEGRLAWDGVDQDQPELLALAMVADIKRAVLLQGGQQFAQEAGEKIAARVTYGGRVHGYPKDGSKAVSARVRIDVMYREKYGAPTAST